MSDHDSIRSNYRTIESSPGPRNCVELPSGGGAASGNETWRDKRSASPFFRPSTPKAVIVKEETLLRNKSGATDKLEKKSSVMGTYFNLVNTIVGAGIIGIPYSINETGLVCGLVLVFGVAMLTDKSLRMLIETGKHVHVQSYETLMEAAFGKPGFVFISVNMFLMSYGAMIAYLLVLKDTIPVVFGVDSDDGKRVFLLVSSFLIILPLSMQRDMAEFSKTSAMSVGFNLFMVFIVAICAPVRDTVRELGGLREILTKDVVNPSTFFVGMGVLSFAFVCQDTSFIIAGSLDQPTSKRWGMVTRPALFTCAALASIIGVTGYLGFQGATEGNVLNNFQNIAPDDMLFEFVPKQVAIDIARGLIGLAMFTVYPMSQFVARHALVVLLFSGRKAHEGDDHVVLARRDRRIALTLALYLASIIPALMYDDTGIVLAATGTVAGSCLSYLSPGSVYIAIYGKTFLDLAKWNVSPLAQKVMWKYPIDKTQKYLGIKTQEKVERISFFAFGQIGLISLWWILLMPLWCSLASTGTKNLKEFEEEQLRKSPMVQQRLGITVARLAADCRPGDQVNSKKGVPRSGMLLLHKKSSSFDERHLSDSEHMAEMTERYPLLNKPSMLIPPTSGETSKQIQASNGDIANAANNSNDTAEYIIETPELNDESPPPSLFGFILAILYVVIGMIALVAGLWSVSMK